MTWRVLLLYDMLLYTTQPYSPYHWYLLIKCVRDTLETMRLNVSKVPLIWLKAIITNVCHIAMGDYYFHLFIYFYL